MSPLWLRASSDRRQSTTQGAQAVLKSQVEQELVAMAAGTKASGALVPPWGSLLIGAWGSASRLPAGAERRFGDTDGAAVLPIRPELRRELAE